MIEPTSRQQALCGLRGQVLDSPSFGQLRSWADGAVIFDPAAGTIAEVGDYDPLFRRRRERPVRWLEPGTGLDDEPGTTGFFSSTPTPAPARIICPGLIDVHAHLPQYPASGLGQGELLPWLREYIFPLEREFNTARSRQQSPRFFHALARHGTTTAMLYATIYDESCDASFQAAEQSGLRVTLGKVMMDIGSYGDLPPEKIVSVSLAQSERLCRRWHGANGGLLAYAFSPRFAVSCSDKLMRGAAELAARYDAPIQTHLAENLAELERVQQLFPTALDYTDVYDRCGLLTPRTVLGHCLHLSGRETAILAERGSKVAHCPTANFFLTSGLLPLDRILQAGIGVGLGTDVGAGTELNLWQVMRSALETQKARSYHEPGLRLLKPAEAFHLGTQGGAETLGLGRVVGTLEPGKEADLLVIDRAELGAYGDPGALEPAEAVSLCIYRAGPHATLATYVRGKTVYERGGRQITTTDDQ